MNRKKYMLCFKSREAEHAFILGLICSLAYLSCYFARNILSAVSPRMLETGLYTTEKIGIISTAYMICYAAGQLINGAIGDIVKAKHMIFTGLMLAGICSFFMPFISGTVICVCVYGARGYFLSMIYGPMTKTVSENTLPEYATRCCLGFTLAAFLGSPAAGMAAVFFDWQWAFIVCGIILFVMGVLAYVFFTYFEKHGIVKYGTAGKVKNGRGSIRLLIKNQIIKYSLVSVLTGIIRITVIFWIPTYLAQYLGFSSKTSAGIFSAVTLAMSFSPYINNLIVYERIMKRNMDKTLAVMFLLSMISFLMMYVIHAPVVNIIFLIAALMASGGASTVLWSVYCPSLKDTGMVSGATGYLDFLSYAAAAVSNTLFANAVTQIGWGKLILVWFGLMLAGTIISVMTMKRKRDNE